MDLHAPRVRYFGRRWNAPAFNDAVKVEVPLGASCFNCTELVDENDSGIMQIVVYMTGPVEQATHIECHLRSLMGSVAHLEHRCSCYGGDEHDDFTREAARELLHWLIERQTQQGLPQPGFID